MTKHEIASLALAFWPFWVGLIVAFIVGWIESRDRNLDRFEAEVRQEQLGAARGCLIGWLIMLAVLSFLAWLVWNLLLG